MSPGSASGSETYAFDGHYKGQACGGIAVQLANGANALDTAKAVRATSTS